MALGTSMSLVFQAGFLLIIAIYNLGALKFKFLFKSIFTLIFASLGLIAILKLLDIFISSKIFEILFGIPLGAIVFIGICKFFGPEETYMFFEKLINLLRCGRKEVNQARKS